jgi:hypothetical protein
VLLFAPSAAWAQLPAAFDWRNVGGENFTTPALNQGNCGSCWQVSPISAMEAVLEIETGDAELTPRFSAQHPMACIVGNGCEGGNPETTLVFLRDTGTVSASCFPYTAVDNLSCPTATCPVAGQPFVLTQIKSYRRLMSPTTAAIKQEIYDHGPVLTFMEIFQDFYSFSGGIYTHVSGTSLGSKTMILVGWGNEAGTDYWIIQNTWGATWNDAGFFRARIGECSLGEWVWVIDGIAGCNCLDADEDGYVAEGCADPDCAGPRDCADEDRTIHPGATDGCDGVNDDCDSETDEDFVATATSCGVGACAAAGQTTCVTGVVGDDCTPGAATGDDTDCDGVDDDCDGEEDEHHVATTTTCGLGVCAGTGQLLCEGGAPVDTCVTLPGGGSDSDCDGVDEDCDGDEDEHYVATATTCGAGECAGTGQLTCTNAVEADSCAPRADGSTCTGGTCQAGVCVPATPIDPDPDPDPPPAKPKKDGGCAATLGATGASGATGAADAASTAGVAGTAFALELARRRRRRA